MTRSRDTADIVEDVSDELASKLDVAGGKILQVVAATHSTDGSTSSATYADTGLTASITPSSASSEVLVLVTQNLSVYRADASNTSIAGCRIVRNSTVIQTNDFAVLIRAGTNAQGYTDSGVNISMMYLDSPNTTSTTTYKTQFNCGQGLLARVQYGGVNVSAITLMEVSA